MNVIKNKFKLIMILKSIFLTVALLLIYGYKREVELDIVLLIAGLVSVASIFLYFINVKSYVLNQTLKPLLNTDIKSQAYESARMLIHRGRYKMALVKLKLVVTDNPNNINIKKIIHEVERYLN